MSSELEQRPFGRTGEKVSVIGLGGAALYKHSYELGVATVKHALDLGVTYFDTSPAYGERSPDGRWLVGGISQLIMGEGLDGTMRPHLLATKLINYTTERTGFISRSPSEMVPIRYRTVDDCLAQLQDNLRALRRDRVDVLLGHDIEAAKAWIPDARDDNQLLDLDEEFDYQSTALIQALRKAKAQGLCRYIGLSSNQSASLAHVLSRVELDVPVGQRVLAAVSPFTAGDAAGHSRAGDCLCRGRDFAKKRDSGASDEASPSRLTPQDTLGAAFTDERLIKLAETTGISIRGNDGPFPNIQSGAVDHPRGRVHARGVWRRASQPRRQVRCLPTFRPFCSLRLSGSGR